MIPFRTQRLATTVVNRILDLHEGIARPAEPGTPAAPSPLPQGLLIEQRLATPPAPVDAPDQATADEVALTSGGLL